MQSARKVVLVEPLIQSGGGPEEGLIESEVKTDKIKSKIYDKIHRFIKIILKLARSVAYDEDLRIKLKNGKYLEKSNIVDLLTHAMSVGKVLYGENEFIQVLNDSNVDPDLIINENVRLKLIQLKNKGKTYRETRDKNSEIEPQRDSTRKRKRDDYDEMPTLSRGDQSYYSGDADTVYVSDSPRPIKKRKLTETTEIDEDSVDDSMIDSDRWTV